MTDKAYSCAICSGIFPNEEAKELHQLHTSHNEFDFIDRPNKPTQADRRSIITAKEIRQKLSSFPIKDQSGNDYKPFGEEHVPFGGQCQDCPKKFNTYQEWANHITTEHNVNYKKNPEEFMRGKIKEVRQKLSAFRFDTDNNLPKPEPVDMSEKAQSERLYPIKKNERAYVEEVYSPDRLIPRTRVETHSKYPIMKPGDDLEPLNTERGNLPHSGSDLGTHLEDIHEERKYQKETGEGEPFKNVLSRKFGIGGGVEEKPWGIKSQATLSLDEARKLAKVKQKLGAIGIDFNKEKSTYNDAVGRINKRKEELGKPQGDSFEEDIKRQTYLQYGDKIRPSKPTDEDYAKIISASLEDLKENIGETKIAILHKHRIVMNAISGGFDATPNVTTKVGRWAKIWLLNAKQINGNGWGVSPETIDYNIKFFVNRPYTITAKEWFPNSVYETYDHPFVPTSDIKKVLAHQEQYRAGTIREVNREGDDYYAVIEIDPKFANMRIPPFCSPAVFALDPREPENKLTKWLPLHLTGLMDSPAYGARIALLKGTCIGTSHACSVQLKGAKMIMAHEASIVCPIKTSNIKDNLQKLGGYSDPDMSDEEEERQQEIEDTRPKNTKNTEEQNMGEVNYMTTGEKIRPPKPNRSDFRKIISAKEEETNNEPITLDRVIEWHRGNNISKRQHGIDPNRHNDNQTLELSKLSWEKLDPEQQKLFIKAYSFRHQDADVTNILGYDPRSDSRTWWDCLNPSMREHMLDPHQLLGIRDMVEKNYDELDDGQRGQVDDIFNDRHSESAKDPTKSAAMEQPYTGGIHPNAGKVHEELKKVTDNINNPVPDKMAMFMTPEGEFVGDGDEHYHVVRKLGPTVGIIPTGHGEAEIPEFLKRTGMIRVQSFPRRQKYSFHIVQSPTVGQLRSIRDVEKSDPNASVGYAIQDEKGTDTDPEAGFRGIMSALRQHSMVKGGRLLMAQFRLEDKLQKLGGGYPVHCPECKKGFPAGTYIPDHLKTEHGYNDEDVATYSVFGLKKASDDGGEENMTYMDSKPTKVIKKKPGQEISLDEIKSKLASFDIVFNDHQKKQRKYITPSNPEPSPVDEHGDSYTLPPDFEEPKDDNIRPREKNIMRRGKELRASLQKLANFDMDQPPQVKINPQHGKIIADAYDNMKHDPSNPEVKRAYGALIDETKTQFNDLMKRGLKIDRIKEGQENPYKDSETMHKDIEKNNHLYYFPTESGFGSGQEDHKDHPMLQPTEYEHEGKKLLANDMFRIVHDINGHHKGGRSSFSPSGEHQAYLTHKKMYSPLANKALFTETAGQSNHVNFGPNGEHNRRDPEHTIFPEQKAGLMPDNIINMRAHQ